MEPAGLAIGAAMAAAIGLFANLAGFDRERSFYPTVLIVIASYYALFAASGGSALGAEALLMTPFLAAAVIGFRKSAWIVVVALAAHGVLDAVHAQLVVNPGVPAWWPPFCLAYDLVAACWLGGLLVRRGKTGGI